MLPHISYDPFWPFEVESLKHNWRRKWTPSLKFVLFLFEVSMSCFLFVGSKSLFGSLKKENIANHNCLEYVNSFFEPSL
jgi:hypothetical protein